VWEACYGSRVFGLGMLEILVIAGLAVLLFPPKELPKLARGIARMYGTVRRTADEFKRAIMVDEDLRNPLDEVKEVYDEARWEVRRTEQDARRELAKAKLEARIKARNERVAGRQVSNSAELEDDVPEQVEPVSAPVAPAPPTVPPPPATGAPKGADGEGSREGAA
jgi:Sec-independent protein translocase protein TatA